MPLQAAINAIEDVVINGRELTITFYVNHRVAEQSGVDAYIEEVDLTITDLITFSKSGFGTFEEAIIAVGESITPVPED
jgi:hypothetical protein